MSGGIVPIIRWLHTPALISVYNRGCMTSLCERESPPSKDGQATVRYGTKQMSIFLFSLKKMCRFHPSYPPRQIGGVNLTSLTVLFIFGMLPHIQAKLIRKVFACGIGHQTRNHISLQMGRLRKEHILRVPLES